MLSRRQGTDAFVWFRRQGTDAFVFFFFVIVIELYINGAKMISNVTRFECVSNYFDDKIDDKFFLSST